MCSRDSEDFWKHSEFVWEFRSVPELNIVQRGVSVEVKNKDRSLEVTRFNSGSPEQRFGVQGGSR